MTSPIPPHTELRMRQCGEAVWNATCAHDPNITPKQAFTEGHYVAFAAGMLANAETTQMYEKKLEQRRLEVEWLHEDLKSLRQDLRLARYECCGLWLALVIAAVVIVGVLSR